MESSGSYDCITYERGCQNGQNKLSLYLLSLQRARGAMMSGMSKWQRKTQEEQRALGSQKSESENNEKQSCQSTHGHLTIMSILGPNMEGCKILVLVILFQIVWIDVSSSFEMKMLRCSMPTCLSGQKIITTRLSPRQSLSPRFSPIRLEMTDSSLSDDILNDDNDFTKMHDAGKLRQEAETLKARAKAIAAEARAMEKELKQSRYRHLKEKVTESDDLIQGLFPHSDSSSQTYSSFSPHTIAKKLRSQRWSPEQVLAVVDRIYERQTEAMGQSMQASPHEFQIGSIQNVEKRANVTEYEKLDDILDTLMKAVAILDTEVSDGKKNENKRWTGSVENALRTRMKELKRIQELNFKRETAKQINEVAISNESVEEYVRRTFVGQGEATDQDRADGNITDVLERVSLVPMWVPSSFLPFIINSKTSSLGPEEVEAIKEEVLLGSRFYVTRTESVPGAALFRGNIRTPRGGIDTDVCKNQTAMVFADIQHRLQQKILDNKIQLFLMPDPEWRPGRDERETEPKPVILALSKAITPDESKIETGTLVESGKKLAYALSLLTAFAYSVSSYALNPRFFDLLVHKKDATALVSCLPVFLGILSIQAIHETAHYLVAKINKIKIGFPVPLPSPQFGLFGCITPLKSFPPNRAALLDLALSGPLTATIVSLGCIVGGLFLTIRASPASIANFPFVPAMIMKSSFLIGWLASGLASKTLLLPMAQPLPVHPLFMVGYSGLIASALNLLPIFRLDGGRACSAAMGPRQCAVISVSVLITVLSLVLTGGSGLGFTWGMIVTIFQRRPEIPARDEATEVDKFRLSAWFFSFLLSLAILTPFPGAPSML